MDNSDEETKSREGTPDSVVQDSSESDSESSLATEKKGVEDKVSIEPFEFEKRFFLPRNFPQLIAPGTAPSHFQTIRYFVENL